MVSGIASPVCWFAADSELESESDLPFSSR
jgi:hypothetical protein